MTEIVLIRGLRICSGVIRWCNRLRFIYDRLPERRLDTDTRCLSRHRSVPMQVLAMGFSRTGTTSLKKALEMLGYVRTNHGWDAFATAEELELWITAVKAKFHEKGPAYGREEWDRLLGDCQAVADVPHILFAAELIAAYPDAKVVLNMRNPDTWWPSFQATVGVELQPSLLRRINAWVSPELAGRYDALMHLVFTILFKEDAARVSEETAKKRFLEHYEELRRLVPKERVLEYEVKQGWVPLCTFLGKEPPATAFPRVNDQEQYHRATSPWRFFLWNVAPRYVGGLSFLAAALVIYAKKR
ncbi:P-loop containing nucleoside triphosphate hydrolase protein [Mycena latifolia]|nr:P-loop containing nucleoside triphosphate hydrolase protein [Mycena latifolia]